MKLPAKYVAAHQALANATRVDEVKDIRDKALAMEVYAYQAKDGELVAMAVDIKDRATRRIGELMEEGKNDRAGHGGDRKSSVSKKRLKPTLAQTGIDNNLASRARKMAAMPENEFEAQLKKKKDIAVAAATNPKEAIKAVRAELHENKKQERAAREKELAGKLKALPQKKYGVILADPEWRFKTYSEKGLDLTSAANHYPTSELEDIKARDVASIAADDCVLWLWATVPMHPQAIEVMQAWGFKYVSHFCWHKNKAGTGYWNRNKYELLLIGTKGKIPAPAQGTLFESVFFAPVSRHSEKPEISYRIIEAYYPNVPKIELNCRGLPRAGWDGWGLEAAA